MAYMHDKPIKMQSSKAAWSCPWFTVRRDEVVLPGGQTGTYNVIDKSPCVFIVPVTTDRNIILIHHYRYPIDQWCCEVPAGGQKKGASLEESARDELLEEVGGVANEWKHVGHFYPSNGTMNEEAHVFLATDVVCGEHAREPMEIMEVHEKPLEEVLTMAKTGHMTDASSALAVLLCEQYLRR